MYLDHRQHLLSDNVYPYLLHAPFINRGEEKKACYDLLNRLSRREKRGKTAAALRKDSAQFHLQEEIYSNRAIACIYIHIYIKGRKGRKREKKERNSQGDILICRCHENDGRMGSSRGTNVSPLNSLFFASHEGMDWGGQDFVSQRRLNAVYSDSGSFYHRPINL